MTNLEEYRKKIDEIDRTLIEKVDERMRVSEGIAEYKQANDLEIVDPLRERALMEKITEDSANDMAYYNRMLFSLLMEMSGSPETGDPYGVSGGKRNSPGAEGHVADFPGDGGSGVSGRAGGVFTGRLRAVL